MVVRLSVCLSVCLSTRITQKPCGRTSPNFLCMLPVAVIRLSSDGVAICYVLPVLQMTSCFHAMGTIGGRTGTALCTSSPVAASGAQAAVGRPAR